MAGGNCPTSPSGFGCCRWVGRRPRATTLAKGKEAKGAAIVVVVVILRRLRGEPQVERGLDDGRLRGEPMGEGRAVTTTGRKSRCNNVELGRRRRRDQRGIERERQWTKGAGLLVVVTCEVCEERRRDGLWTGLDCSGPVWDCLGRAVQIIWVGAGRTCGCAREFVAWLMWVRVALCCDGGIEDGVGQPLLGVDLGKVVDGDEGGSRELSTPWSAGRRAGLVLGWVLCWVGDLTE